MFLQITGVSILMYINLADGRIFCCHLNEYLNPSYSFQSSFSKASFEQSVGNVWSPSFQREMESGQTLECRVCGGPANGYHFDQLCCESCKAFFRRNALRDLVRSDWLALAHSLLLLRSFQTYLKCRFIGRCQITMKSRRQCTYCRIKKCFDVKMRKEWIQTNEEIQCRKLERLERMNEKERSPSEKYSVRLEINSSREILLDLDLSNEYPTFFLVEINCGGLVIDQ